MKKLVLGMFVMGLLCLLAPLGVAADGIIVSMPVPGHPKPPVRSLAIKYHRVTVTIDNQVATTHVDQVFINENSYDLEGEYIFPLPEDAAISQFAMWVDGRRLEAQALDRDEAQRIYEEIVRQRRDPALLEYVGRDAFRARVYPIPARGEKHIELEYSQVLSRDEDLVRYVYPLNTEKFSTRPLQDVSVRVALASRQDLMAIYSPSHEVTVDREGDTRAQIVYQDEGTTPDTDFVLYYGLGEDDLGVNLISFKEEDEDGFFMLLLSPDTDPDARDVVAKDVFFVLDISGSMRGTKLDQAKKAARYVLDNLGAEDRFNIIAFSTSTRHYARELVSATKADDARAFIKDLVAGGGTNIHQALEETLSQMDRGRPQMVVFLTDGLASAGEKRTERIVSLASDLATDDARIFCFGVGYDVNTTLLDLVSSRHHGTTVYVRPDKDLEHAVSSFYSKISTPVLTGLSIDYGMIHAEETYPHPLPDAFAGGQIVVVGRYREGGTTDLMLKGTVNGDTKRYHYEDIRFRKDGGAEFIPHLWATRKVGHLLTEIRLHGSDPELVDEITALGLRYGIVTPYTSFLVDETEDAPGASPRVEVDGRAPAMAPKAQPFSLGEGRGGGAATTNGAVPTAAVSGQWVVEKVIVEKEMREADTVSSHDAQVRAVGERTFVLRDGVWVDTAYDANKHVLERVRFGSDRYFDLLRQYDEWGRYLALGREVILVWNGIAYHVGATEDQNGSSGALAEPQTPRPVTGPRPTAEPTLEPTPAAGDNLWFRVGRWVQALF